jgi:uncharacterized protein involved in outer membrane biogenesis
LFSKAKILDIQISKPVMKKAALDLYSAFSAKKSEGGEGANVHVRHIEIDELQLIWPDTTYPKMNVDVTLNEASKLESANVETLDGKLHANIEPNGDEQLITLNANKWTLPAGLPLLIDQATLEMHLKDSRLKIPKIDIALYGGKLTGDALVSWGNGWKTSGNLHVDNLSVKEPSSLVSKSVYLSGNLFGSGNFSGTAKTAGQLADNLHADFKFNVNNGVLNGLDLVKVASLLLKQNQGGGETQFDEFSGLLNVSGKQYHLRNLKISSGLLAATGQVKIKPNKQLDGAIEVDVKKAVGLAAIPLDVSGTLSNPVVLPSKAALAGALAGTAVLGPAGTSLGMKAGSKAGGALDKLKGLFK